MSLTSKIVLVSSGLACIGTVYYVHYKQNYDRQQLRLGVVRDLERQERRKAENIYVLQQQKKLEKHLRQQMAEEETQVNQ